ncbi:MAG: cytochrome c3 family protein [Gammaproteobacteria bacterium]|nr:cytochrome c3 family protein [Gammaproteobacteria bacterium]
MRLAALLFITLIVLALWRGTPLPVSHPQKARYWDAPQALLPMSFAHDDHGGENCTVCHHNFVDDTGADTCMRCHVNDTRVAASLEQQFHGLCMGCHVERQLAGEKHGPARHCSDCHLQDERP